MYGIEWWYCCLNVRERTVIRQTCEGLVLTLFVGVPLVVWEAFWLVLADSGEACREAFLSIYGLEIATIEGEEGAVVVVRPVDGSLPDWVAYSIFMLSPNAACLAGCGQSRVP